MKKQGLKQHFPQTKIGLEKKGLKKYPSIQDFHPKESQHLY